MTHELDIRGLICPLTWARVRLELSRLAPGDVLQITLDHRPAVPDIRRNAEALGHDVLSAVEDAPGVWRIELEVDDDP